MRWRVTIAVMVWISCLHIPTAAGRQAPVRQTSKDIEAEITPVPRAAAPGGTIKLLYTIYNYENDDQRVRIRVDRAGGWQPFDPEDESRELVVPGWDNIEGDLYVTVPADLRPGNRAVVRLLVRVVAEDGEVEARNVVPIVPRGSAKPGVRTFSGTATLGATGLRPGEMGAARRNEALTLSSKFGPRNAVSFTYDRGLRDALSNFRYEEDRTRMAGDARVNGWEATFGNTVTTPGNALSGPFVRGRGAAIRRSSGPLLAEFMAVQPSVLQGRSDGHAWRAAGGLRKPRARVAFTLADFARPGGYTSLASVQTTVLDPETQARQDYERRLTTASASNRVRAFGVDTQLTPSPAHNIAFRAGEITLANTAGIETHDPVGEFAYTMTTKALGLNARWRSMPATLPGIYLSGDERGADAQVRLNSSLHAIGSVSQYSTSTYGSSLAAHGQAFSTGLRAMRRGTFLEVRGNVRDSNYGTALTRQTISALASTTKGPWAVMANTDVGSEIVASRRAFTAFAMGSVKWTRDGNTWSLMVTHSDSAGIQRERADLLLSTRVRWAELAGGAWVTRGYAFGGQPGSWFSVGLPTGADTVATIGFDYSPVTWTAQPSLRGIVSIRKRFTAPVPFVPVARQSTSNAGAGSSR